MIENFLEENVLIILKFYHDFFQLILIYALG